MDPFNPATAYRQTAARCASPVGLIVMAYDAAEQALRGAMRAIENGDVEQRTTHLNHLMTVIAVLQSALDFERGGDVARRLDRFYQIARAKALEAGMKASPEMLSELSRQFAMLREAWSQIEHTSTPAALCPSSNSSSGAPSQSDQVAFSWSV